jgi:5-formyltetrahydrofolate cyclo-ligase
VQALTAAQRELLERQLGQVLEPLFHRFRCIAGYHPMTNEVSPLQALDRASAMGRTIAHPSYAGRDHHMVFRAGPPVEPGPWAFMQPSDDAPEVEPDLILVPLVAIDREGHRIGQGQGHYDRALPALRARGGTAVGVGWAFQLVDQLIAHDPWDSPLDAFASPDGLVEFRR